MIELFEDQKETIDFLRQSMRKNKRVLLRGETGSGKSIMATYMIKNAISKGNKVAFTVPRKELLRQMAETFNNYNIEYSYVASGKPFDPWKKVFLCTVGTLANRKETISPDIVFIDETHYGDKAMDSINKYYTEKRAWIIGLTATPDNRNLYKWYDDMVEGLDLKALIARKRLSDYRYFAPSSPDLSSIKVVNGEYAKGEVNSYMKEKTYLVGDAVAHYKKYAMGKLNMTFCTSIENSKLTCAQFNDNGVPSAHMDGDTPERERIMIAKAFAKREILNITSVDLLLFGYDLSNASGVKDAVVESISDLKPNKSKKSQRQKIGRALRYKPNPALIFDHVSNYKIHGLPDDDVEWTLAKPKVRESKSTAPPTKQCDKCFFVHNPAPKCPECGYVYKVQSHKIEQVDGELVELQKDMIRKQERQEQGRTDTLDGLIKLGISKGYKNPDFWAKKVLAGRRRKK